MAVGTFDSLATCDARALRVLERAGIHGAQVIRVDSEAVLFHQEDEAWTAWLSENRRTILRLDHGFVADYA